MITGVLLVVSNLAAYLMISPALGGGGGLTHRLMLVGLLLVMAASTQVWQLGRQSYLGTALPPTMRARGMTLFGGVIRLGEVIGPLLGAVVIALGSMAWVFLLFAVSAAAGTVMIALFLPPGEAGPVPTRPRGERRPRTPARTRLDRAVLRRMVAVGIGIAPVMMARVNRPVIVPLLGDSLGLDPMWISIVFGVSAALEILLVLPAGTLMDRYGRAAVAVPCALLMGAGFLLLALLGTVFDGGGPTLALVALLVPSLLIGVGNGLGSGIVMTLGIDVSPVHGRTTYLAWWNTMLGAGRLAAPLVVTGITLVAPVAVAGAATGVICVAGGVWLTRTLPARHTLREHPEEVRRGSDVAARPVGRRRIRRLRAGARSQRCSGGEPEPHREESNERSRSRRPAGRWPASAGCAPPGSRGRRRSRARCCG